MVTAWRPASTHTGLSGAPVPLQYTTWCEREDGVPKEIDDLEENFAALLDMTARAANSL